MNDSDIQVTFGGLNINLDAEPGQRKCVEVVFDGNYFAVKVFDTLSAGTTAMDNAIVHRATVKSLAEVQAIVSEQGGNLVVRKDGEDLNGFVSYGMLELLNEQRKVVASMFYDARVGQPFCTNIPAENGRRAISLNGWDWEDAEELLQRHGISFELESPALNMALG